VSALEKKEDDSKREEDSEKNELAQG